MHVCMYVHMKELTLNTVAVRKHKVCGSIDRQVDQSMVDASDVLAGDAGRPWDVVMSY
jgi:hypothetical protein